MERESIGIPINFTHPGKADSLLAPYMVQAEYAKTPHKKLPISRGRYQLIPVLSDLFAKKSFSGHKLDQTLKENHFTDEDRALFTELFYGFLRYGHQLLFFVDKFLPFEP